MTDSERLKYLTDHFNLYLAQETSLALLRAQERMKPHIVAMADDMQKEYLIMFLQSVWAELR